MGREVGMVKKKQKKKNRRNPVVIKLFCILTVVGTHHSAE